MQEEFGAGGLAEDGEDADAVDRGGFGARLWVVLARGGEVWGGGTDKTFGGFPGSGSAEGVGVGCSARAVSTVQRYCLEIYSYLTSFTQRASLIIYFESTAGFEELDALIGTNGSVDCTLASEGLAEEAMIMWRWRVRGEERRVCAG